MSHIMDHPNLNALEKLALSQVRTGNMRWQRLFWQLIATRNKDTLIKLSEKWLREGHFNEAFELVYHGTQMSRSIRRSSIQQYRRLCELLAKDGFLLESDQRLERLTHSIRTRKIGTFLKSEFHTKYADLAPKNIETMYDLAARYPRSGNIHAILRYLAISGAKDPKLQQAYEKSLKETPQNTPYWPRLGHDYLSLFWQDCEDRSFLKDIEQRVQIDPRSCSLSIEKGILSGKLTGPVTKAAYAPINAYTQFSSFCDAIWARLSDEENSVAVVGNSPKLLGSKQGVAIDAHDIVVRFNMASRSTKHAVDVGRKTNILVINQALLANNVTSNLHDMDIIVTGPDWYHFTFGKRMALQLLRQGCRLAFVPDDIQKALVTALWASPSSGIAVLQSIRELRQSFENVQCYGFAFTDQTDRNAQSANYFRQSKPNPRHNWAGEARLFKALRTSQAALENVNEELGVLRYSNTIGELTQFSPKRIKIGGDHSNYHCGSRAVTEHMQSALGQHGILVKDNNYDILVMNGEGSMHHDNPHYQSKMVEMREAADAGKAVYLVNSVWQDNHNVDIDLLNRLQLIQVREQASQRDLLENHGIKSSVYPDLSFYCATVPTAPNPIYKNQIVLTDFYSHEFKTFARWTGAEGLKHPHIDMRKTSWSQMVADIEHAEMLITGRHHAVFAACRANTPFIAFSGNTHKVSGLLHAAGVNIPMASKREELPVLIEWVRNNRAEYEKLFYWLQSFPSWSPFV